MDPNILAQGEIGADPNEVAHHGHRSARRHASMHGEPAFGVAMTSSSGGKLKEEKWILANADGTAAASHKAWKQTPSRIVVHDYVQPNGKDHPVTDAPGDPKNDAHIKTTWTKLPDGRYSFVMQTETTPGVWKQGGTGTLARLLTPNAVIYGGAEGIKKHALAKNGGTLAGAVGGFFVGGPVGAVVGALAGRYGGGKIAGED